jgi:plastocyanin domain-containing protein
MSTTQVITPEIINMLTNLVKETHKVKHTILEIEKEMNTNDNQYYEIVSIHNMLTDNIEYMERVIDILPTE